MFRLRVRGHLSETMKQPVSAETSMATVIPSKDWITLSLDTYAEIYITQVSWARLLQVVWLTMPAVI